MEVDMEVDMDWKSAWKAGLFNWMTSTMDLVALRQCVLGELSTQKKATKRLQPTVKRRKRCVKDLDESFKGSE